VLLVVWNVCADECVCDRQLRAAELVAWVMAVGVVPSWNLAVLRSATSAVGSIAAALSACTEMAR